MAENTNAHGTAFRVILVPLNFTPANQRAIDLVSKMALQNGARVELVHVIETIRNIPFDELADFYGSIEASARAKLAPIVEDLAARGNTVNASVIHGRRDDEILNFIESRGIDLVVLSSHALDGSNVRHSIDSVSYKIGLLARCSVLLAR